MAVRIEIGLKVLKFLLSQVTALVAVRIEIKKISHILSRMPSPPLWR